MNLYVVQGVRGGGPISDVMYGTVPFFVMLVLLVVLLILFPGLALWLPNRMFG